MNKTEFITALAEKTGYSEEKCAQVNSILEDTLIFGKKHQAVILEKFQDQLELGREAAEQLYDNVMTLVGSEVKDKLKHPFRSQD